MKCPKCGFISFDYLDQCKQCGKDWGPKKALPGVERDVQPTGRGQSSSTILEEGMSTAALEVLLDDGEPAENVPRSVQNDGHKLLSLEKENGHFKMIIEKV